MKFILFIARRYLFSKKSHNAINIISMISIVGVVVSTAALVCVMSVFNGFVEIIEKSFSAFDPDLRIVSAEGKTFDFEEIVPAIKASDNIEAFSRVLEDDALITYYDKQTPFTLKGVDRFYRDVFEVDSIMLEGAFRLHDLDFDVSVVGAGLATTLNLGVDYVSPITIYVPVREGKINILRPDAAFKKGEMFVGGIFFSNQPEIDESVVIAPIEFVQKMYDYDGQIVSNVALKLKNPKELSKTENALQKSLGEKFLVENRQEQQRDYFKIIKIERLLIFIILLFMLFIAVCNIISSLSLLLIEKRSDIEIFRHLGMNEVQIRRVFLIEGWLMSAIGTVIGLALGLLLCWLQIRFGLIKMGENILIENYPVAVEVIDLVVILLTVLTIGFLSSLLTVSVYFRRKKMVE